MALKPIPRLILIAAVVGGGIFGVVKFVLPNIPKSETVVQPVVETPVTKPVELPVQQTQIEPAAPVEPSTSVTSGAAGMAELLKNNANKK